MKRAGFKTGKQLAQRLGKEPQSSPIRAAKRAPKTQLKRGLPRTSMPLLSQHTPGTFPTSITKVFDFSQTGGSFQSYRQKQKNPTGSRNQSFRQNLVSPLVPQSSVKITEFWKAINNPSFKAAPAQSTRNHPLASFFDSNTPNTALLQQMRKKIHRSYFYLETRLSLPPLRMPDSKIDSIKKVQENPVDTIQDFSFVPDSSQFIFNPVFLHFLLRMHRNFNKAPANAIEYIPEESAGGQSKPAEGRATRKAERKKRRYRKRKLERESQPARINHQKRRKMPSGANRRRPRGPSKEPFISTCSTEDPSQSDTDGDNALADLYLSSRKDSVTLGNPVESVRFSTVGGVADLSTYPKTLYACLKQVKLGEHSDSFSWKSDDEESFIYIEGKKVTFYGKDSIGEPNSGYKDIRESIDGTHDSVLNKVHEGEQKIVCPGGFNPDYPNRYKDAVQAFQNKYSEDIPLKAEVEVDVTNLSEAGFNKIEETLQKILDSNNNPQVRISLVGIPQDSIPKLLTKFETRDNTAFFMQLKNMTSSPKKKMRLR